MYTMEQNVIIPSVYLDMSIYYIVKMINSILLNLDSLSK